MCIALVLRPPPFLLSICIHNNTWERKTSKNGEGLGAFDHHHHISGCEVDVGGEGPIFKYVTPKLESEFLTSQDKYFQLC